MTDEVTDLGRIESVTCSAYTVPTDQPESDGTARWDSTTIVVVEVIGAGATGLGYSYTDAAAVTLVRGVLAPVVTGRPIDGTGGSWAAMVDALRNIGRPGVGSAALSAVDIALWDLKARLLQLPVASLTPVFHDAIPVYGSGGFTSYSDAQLQEQLGAWVDQGISSVKMKVGREPDRDEQRVAAARSAIGDAALFVDANGAWTRKQALDFATRFAAYGVSWLEEPVTSDDLDGLRMLRDRTPAGMDVTAGEYGYDLPYFRRMLNAGAVDCLQADVTRCGGLTGFLAAAALCDAHTLDLSAHTAPSVSAHACAGVWHLRHLEYFHDHVRLEQMLFDGSATAEKGVVRPDSTRAGLGLTLKRSDAQRYAAS